MTSSRGPRPTQRRSGQRAAGRHRPPARARAWPSCGPTSPTALDRARRAHRRAQPRPRHADRSSSTASSTRSGATSRWPTASTSTHRRLLDIAESEGHLDEVEDELFRFARIVEGNDELRMALSNPGLPADRRAAIVDELLENRALPTTRAIVTFIVDGRPRARPARDRRRVRRARGADAPARGRRGSLGGAARRRAGARGWPRR